MPERHEGESGEVQGQGDLQLDVRHVKHRLHLREGGHVDVDGERTQHCQAGKQDGQESCRGRGNQGKPSVVASSTVARCQGEVLCDFRQKIKKCLDCFCACFAIRRKAGVWRFLLPAVKRIPNCSPAVIASVAFPAGFQSGWHGLGPKRCLLSSKA
ncbi:hypothetical protein D3C78_437980 [compost metagenome]